MSRTYVRLLTIAGSDSGGGAGIQADLKTFSALGVYGMSVITALTAQNTVRVESVHPLPASFVADQLDAVLSDIGADAVKIGMLFNAEIIEAVASRLRRYELTSVILDPVMVAKSGDPLLRAEAVEALKRYLLPRAELITPNLPEAEVLCGRPCGTRSEREAAAAALLELGSRAVLLKGGHAEAEAHADDFLLERGDGGRWLEAPRIHTHNTHGTGCTLSAAIASYRGRGSSLLASVEQGKAYLTRALRLGAEFSLGHGHGPVFHGLPPGPDPA